MKLTITMKQMITIIDSKSDTAEKLKLRVVVIDR